MHEQIRTQFILAQKQLIDLTTIALNDCESIEHLREVEEMVEQIKANLWMLETTCLEGRKIELTQLQPSRHSETEITDFTTVTNLGMITISSNSRQWLVSVHRYLFCQTATYEIEKNIPFADVKEQALNAQKLWAFPVDDRQLNVYDKNGQHYSVELDSGSILQYGFEGARWVAMVDLGLTEADIPDEFYISDEKFDADEAECSEIVDRLFLLQQKDL